MEFIPAKNNRDKFCYLFFWCLSSLTMSLKLKYLFKIFYREKLFVAALLASAVMLCFPSGRTPPGKMNIYSTPVISEEGLLQAVKAGWISSGIKAAAFGLTLFLLGLLAAGIILNIDSWRKGRVRLFAPGPSPRVGWGPGAVARVCVYFLFILLAFQLFQNRSGLLRSRGPSSLIEMAAVQDLIALLLLSGFIRQRGYSFSVFNLRLTDLLSSSRAAVLTYIYFLPYLGVLVVISYLVSSVFKVALRPHPLIPPVLAGGSLEEIAGLFILAAVAGPLLEELFFRGFIYPAFKNRLGKSGAILLSAALFSSLHFNFSGWLPILGLGILLAWSYEKSGKLMVPVLIHSFHNTLFLVYTLLHYKLEV